MDTQTIIADTNKVAAAQTAVLAAQSVGATVAASGGDKLTQALAMASGLSPLLPPKEQATITFLQLMYQMYVGFKHPAFVAATPPAPAPAAPSTQA